MIMDNMQMENKLFLFGGWVICKSKRLLKDMKKLIKLLQWQSWVQAADGNIHEQWLNSPHIQWGEFCNYWARYSSIIVFFFPPTVSYLSLLTRISWSYLKSNHKTLNGVVKWNMKKSYLDKVGNQFKDSAHCQSQAFSTNHTQMWLIYLCVSVCLRWYFLFVARLGLSVRRAI